MLTLEVGLITNGDSAEEEESQTSKVPIPDGLYMTILSLGTMIGNS